MNIEDGYPASDSCSFYMIDKGMVEIWRLFVQV
jgi:hypothetical protein